MPAPQIDRYAAFTDRADCGNPAGVVLDAQHLSAEDMQRIAADVGYSETAFVISSLQRKTVLTVRYFAPGGEVDFCGHATISTAVALGHELGFGDFTLDTRVGNVLASATTTDAGTSGAFQSPTISSSPITAGQLKDVLHHLGWDGTDLHPDFPPAIGFGGNHHPVLVACNTSRLARLNYDFEKLRALCLAQNWVTVQLIAPTGAGQWHSRNPFPWGGVIEDPATGAAAAAFAGYLANLGRATTGDRLTITQGIEMGRRSHINVELLATTALISGSVTPIRA
ncbi:PhzF family phenazine biosynthesis protein [Arthrobacter sp. CAN_A212]|uniref:PhzF family phenazine biosynthesis protein n=1 Tax=Arthrobacter sp. CAN_A212 TaxID=2787719 RepID=UPI0018C92E14